MIAYLVTVGTAPTRLVPLPVTSQGGHSSYNQSASVQVPAAANTVFVGGPTVDVTNGYPLVPTASSSISLEWDWVNEPLFAVVVAGTVTVNVLRRGETPTT